MQTKEIIIQELQQIPEIELTQILNFVRAIKEKDTQLRQILHKHKTGLVFARVMPEQKLRLVEAYKTVNIDS